MEKIEDRISLDRVILRSSPKEAKENTPQAHGAPEPSAQTDYDKAALIPLPDPASASLRERDILKVMAERKTIRKLGGPEASLEALSFVLWATQGVRKVTPRAVFRTVPSAGARHPFETWIHVDRVTGLTPGYYRYVGTEHALLPLPTEENHWETLNAALRNQTFGSAFQLIWTAVPERTEWRYLWDGAKFIALDAGHIAQNGYLAAGALGMGCAVLGSYNQAELDRCLGIDGENQMAVYIGVFGYPPVRE